MAKQSTAARSNPRRSRRAPERRPSAASKNVHPIAWSIPFTMTNLIIIGVGIAVIVVGYILMSSGIPESRTDNAGVWDSPMAVTVAPLLLALGYCVIVPIGIFYRKKSQDAEVGAETPAEA